MKLNFWEMWPKINAKYNENILIDERVSLIREFLSTRAGMDRNEM